MKLSRSGCAIGAATAIEGRSTALDRGSSQRWATFDSSETSLNNVSGAGTRDVTPSASRLTTSLRDLGYDSAAAIADIVDNSVDAGARRIGIRIEFAGAASRIIVADDGCGMRPQQLEEALRFGSRRPYGERDLGRFGLGLKTAALSLGRRLTVLTRHGRRGVVAGRALDLDHIQKRDRWEILAVRTRNQLREELEALGGCGTVVVIDRLDRLLNESRPDSGWSRRRLSTLAERTAEHLGMVHHRFLEGSAGRRVRMKVNDRAIVPWNPFAIEEKHALRLGEYLFDLESDDGVAAVRLRPFILPPRSRFSSQMAFDRFSGPLKWNRQQGFYIYRANRMIQSGGWCGLRAPDEHTKLARIALDFPSVLDGLFHVNVTKTRVGIPVQLRKVLEQPVHEVCQRADSVYRSDDLRNGREGAGDQPVQRRGEALRVAALAISVAANEVGEFAALERIMARVRDTEPELAREMGWS